MAAQRKTNYPDLAESTFQSLCDAHGVTRNKAIQDRTGWDYLLEFDRTPITGAAHDRQVGSSTARVQIKSTIGSKPKSELKLSNAMRFTSEADICFAVLFQFRRDGLSHRIFARHFHAELMTQSLKRAREADRDGVDGLHGICIPVVFGEADEHTHDLLLWMHAICDQQPESYAVDKRNLADTLGYGDRSYGGTYTLKVEHLQSMVDNAVGLIPSMPIEHVTMEDRRFGIPARTPIFDGTPTLFSISVPPESATLSLHGENGYRVQLNGEMRSAYWPGLPMEAARAVFSSPCLSVLMQGDGQCEISWAIDVNTAYRLSDLLNVALFQKATRSATELTITLAGKAPIQTTSPPQSSADSRWFDWLHAIVGGLSKVCGFGDDPTMSLHELGAEAEAAMRFVQFLSDGELTLRFTLGNAVSELPTVRNLIGYVLTRVGQRLFWAIARRPCLDLQCDGIKYTIVFGNPVIVDCGVVSADQPDIVAYVKLRLSELSPKLGTGTLLLNDGDVSTAGERLDIYFQ